MCEQLSDEDKTMPCVKPRSSGATSVSVDVFCSDGLGLEIQLLINELSPVNEKHIKILPMCLKNLEIGKLALQVYPSAIRVIHLPREENDGSKGSSRAGASPPRPAIKARLH